MSKDKKVTVPDDYITGKYAVGTECFSIVDIGRREVLEQFEVFQNKYTPYSLIRLSIRRFCDGASHDSKNKICSWREVGF